MKIKKRTLVLDIIGSLILAALPWLIGHYLFPKREGVMDVILILYTVASLVWAAGFLIYLYKHPRQYIEFK